MFSDDDLRGLARSIETIIRERDGMEIPIAYTLVVNDLSWHVMFYPKNPTSGSTGSSGGSAHSVSTTCPKCGKPVTLSIGP